MREMKVIRKRRRRISKAAVKRRKIIILSLMTLFAAGVVCGISFLCVNYLVNSEDSTLPTQPPCVIENGKITSLTIENGETSILTVAAEDEILNTLKFSCDNKNILLVDSGGRIDAKGEGQTVVTVTGENFTGKCNVKVVKKAEKPKSTEYTTAYIANNDIAEKNKLNSEKLLYSITVNRRTNTVTVYTYDDNGDYIVPVRAMVCSCGEFSEENITPTGEYSVYFKNRWHSLFGDVYGQYVTGFSGHYLFHSVPYTSVTTNSLEAEEFNKLGTNASQGCVRLMVSDAKWIYENCPLDTKVTVIDDDEKSDLLSKPPVVKINPKAKWDPTDLDEKNPYRKRHTVISGAENKTIKLNTPFDAKKGIKVTDICGQDITDKMTVIGNVMTGKKGKYYVTYMVEDDLKIFARKTIIVTVE